MESLRNVSPQQLSPPSAFIADRAPRFCLLCGGPQDVIGIYVPGDSRDWGAPEGKDRRFIYALCERCFRKPDAPIRVEKVIQADLAGGAPVFYNTEGIQSSATGCITPVTDDEDGWLK